MPGVLDVFNDDAFGLVSMTEAVDKVPFKPGRLGQMGLFRSKGVPTTVAVFDEREGELQLIPSAARGSMPNPGQTERGRKARAITIPHIPFNELVMADDIQGVRKFGTENALESVSSIVADKLERARANHEFTWEYQRVGAIKGTVLDADGATTMYNLFTEFNITAYPDVTFVPATANDYKLKSAGIIRDIANALGGEPLTGVHAICGDNFFDTLVTDDEVKTAYDRQNESAFLREGQTWGTVQYAGITWENYRGSVAGTPFVADNEAHFFPVGTRLFMKINGPPTFVTQANTIGRDLYAKQERMEFDTGIKIHTQSNPLFVCTRPKVLIKGTL